MNNKQGNLSEEGEFMAKQESAQAVIQVITAFLMTNHKFVPKWAVQAMEQTVAFASMSFLKLVDEEQDAETD